MEKYCILPAPHNTIYGVQYNWNQLMSLNSMGIMKQLTKQEKMNMNC